MSTSSHLLVINVWEVKDFQVKFHTANIFPVSKKNSSADNDSYLCHCHDMVCHAWFWKQSQINNFYSYHNQKMHTTITLRKSLKQKFSKIYNINLRMQTSLSLPTIKHYARENTRFFTITHDKKLSYHKHVMHQQHLSNVTH